MAKLSPMMTEYMQLKENYKDAILFYRLGDFYEMFFEDAILVSKLLELTLTGRDCGLEERAPMCGIPFHAAESYIARLVSKGYKVAICEQVSDVKDKTKSSDLVKRKIVRIITPGTVVDASMLDNSTNNYIASVYLNKENVKVDIKEQAKNWEDINEIRDQILSIKGASIAFSDISTGEFKVEEIKLGGIDALKEINVILNRICPSEIVVNEADKKILKNCDEISHEFLQVLTSYYDYAFEKKGCQEALLGQFDKENLSDVGINLNSVKLIAAGALVIYLADTQKRSLGQINKIENIQEQKFLKLDVASRRNLELTETSRERKRRGSLLWVLDSTSTSMGARLIKNWISNPLQDEKEINLRLNAVEDLVKNLIKRTNLVEDLNKISDIERIGSRIAYGNFSPRDAIQLKNSIENLSEIKSLLSGFSCKKLTAFYEDLDPLKDIFGLLDETIDKDAPAVLNSGGKVIKDGYNAELDEYRSAKDNSKAILDKLETKEKEETGIKNLKICFNKVFGYFIEIPKSQISLVPYRYQRKQTTVNTERYITDELKQVEDKVLNATENAQALQESIFGSVRNYLLENLKRIQKTASILAELDVLLSFATVAMKNNYVKPTISSKIDSIKIVAGRHPVVEQINRQEAFVPNDTYLNSTTDKSLIITGPNMAGKSTYMRQVALITLMAHVGSFVPANEAEIAITDRIFTRVGASDDLAYGQSTFMVEMLEVANILNNATEKSLVILDEIGRGTSTFDGLAIAWAVMEYISNKLSIKTIFSTHYHELTELEGFLRGVKNYKITVKEINDEVVFLRKVVRGGANKSFGIAVANLAGLPKEVITRAKEISVNLENADINRKIAETNLGVMQEAEQIKKSYSDVIGILNDIDVNMLSPLGAFDILVDLVSRVKK